MPATHFSRQIMDIFHFWQSDMVFGIINPFLWIFNAISSDISYPSTVFPAAWRILIGQVKFHSCKARVNIKNWNYSEMCTSVKRVTETVLRSWWIYSGQGFTSVCHAPWPEWSWIVNFDLHSDHVASKKLTNPLWSMVDGCLWCNMIRVIFDHCCWLGSSKECTLVFTMVFVILNRWFWSS